MSEPTVKAAAETQTVTSAGPSQVPVPGGTVIERVRFGPGVPPVKSAAAVGVAAVVEPEAPEQPKPPPKWRAARILSAGLTAAIVAFVVWFLWPAGPLRVHQLSLRVNPEVVSCGRTAGLVATVTTNGNPGTLRYQWERGDGQHSAILRQTMSRGQGSANLRLSWKFEGPGTYNALATIHLLQPAPLAATVRFTYRCGG